MIDRANIRNFINLIKFINRIKFQFKGPFAIVIQLNFVNFDVKYAPYKSYKVFWFHNLYNFSAQTNSQVFI